MNSKKWLGLVAVIVAAVAIVAYKQVSPPGSTEATTPLPSAVQPAVLLVADPSEAGDPCPCGEIIRAVREAAEQGVPVREVAPGTNPALEREYRVTIAPTVLFFDEAGQEIARHEGEAPGTVEAIQERLNQLTGAEG